MYFLVLQQTERTSAIYKTANPEPTTMRQPAAAIIMARYIRTVTPPNPFFCQNTYWLLWLTDADTRKLLIY